MSEQHTYPFPMPSICQAVDEAADASPAPVPVKTTRRPVTREEFEELCALQATPEEMFGWWGVTEKALNRWCRQTYGKPFRVIRDECVQDGRVHLRRLRMEMAVKSVQLLQNLCKEMLPPPEADTSATSGWQDFLRLASPDPAQLRAMFGEAGGDEI